MPMSWTVDILTSEFLWGLVIGLLLAVVVAWLSVQFEARQKRQLVVDFCVEMIENIRELIQNLEDNRDRNRVIDNEFLEIIQAELIVYGRNREHITRISDRNLRSNIQKYFTRVAVLVVQVQWHLRQFSALNQQDQESARTHLGNAHQACDRLREMRGLGEQLAGGLKKL